VLGWARIESRDVCRIASANGVLYGAVHLPDLDVALVTVAGGVVWSHSYYRERIVYPIAVSHAVLGASYFYWIRDSDLILEICGRLLA
jgi:membrane protease YdiL (CAAX protease family)